MKRSKDPEPGWTLEELNDVAVAALTQDRAAPGHWEGVELGPRTIRYYSTLGLLDRPAAMRGRQALYGARHLFQLVATKRLQARGLSLDEAKARLADLTTDALAAIAEVPEDLIASSLNPIADGAGFRVAWDAAVAEALEETSKEPRLITVSLSPSVTLSVATQHAMSPADIAAVRDSARAVLHTLRGRGLIPPPSESDDDA